MNEFVGAGLLLALLVAAEGIRRCSDDTVVLQRFAFGRWKLAAGARLGSGLCLASLCLPVLLPVVLSQDGDAPSGSVGLRRVLSRARARARRARWAIALLRINGAAVVALLVLALPAATAASGLWGAAGVLVVLLTLCVAQAVVQYAGMRRAGAIPRVALAAAAKSLWLFSAPGAAERVQGQVIADVPTLAAMDFLLGHDAFLESVRPIAYDALHGPHERARARALFDVIDRQMVASFLRTPPAGTDSDPYCPRCGAAYRAEFHECSDCGGVALLS